MPPKTINKRTAQATGTTAYRRAVLAFQRREGKRRARPKPAAVIANSVFALTLREKPGFDVAQLLSGKNSSLKDGDGYYQMYADLFVCMQRAVFLATGERTSFDPMIGEYMSLGESLGYVISVMKRSVVPKNFELRVDKDEDGYHFTIHRYCSFRDMWHVFEIRPVVQYLRAHNPRLHDLFCDFMTFFYQRLDINTWWNGGLGYAEYMMEENILNWEQNWADPEDDIESAEALDRALEAVLHYSCGEVDEYRGRLENQYREYSQIVTAVLQTKVSGPIMDDIINWMRAAIDFMKEPGCMGDYVYREYIHDNEVEGLMFDQQAAILWDVEDPYSKLEAECLDSTAQGCGIYPPQLYYYFTPHTKKFDLEEIEKWSMWPARFSHLWERYADLVERIRKTEKKEKRGKK
jgi:hypothetical protein